ncbi:MAG: hypothetical protein QOE73_378 [Verrucomicrobiota bacterium]
MLPQQFILQEIILRAVARERFQEHSHDEQAAVNAIPAPCQFGAGRIKCDHGPDTNPEKRRHDQDLAEQEKAVETFRALRNHGYVAGVDVRLRDGSQASTRGKIIADMVTPMGKRGAR